MIDVKVDYRDPEWVAERLGIDKNTVYKFLHDGTIPALQLGRKWLISETELAEWMASEAHRQTQLRREATAFAAQTAGELADYSPHAREVVRLAYAEAQRLNHPYLGQEHLLLAIAASPECKAARVLANLNVTPERMRRELEPRLVLGDTPARRKLARTDAARKAMRLAHEEAAQSGSRVVTTELLLLGIIKTGDGVGFELLPALGLTPDRIKDEIARLAARDPQ